LRCNLALQSCAFLLATLLKKSTTLQGTASDSAVGKQHKLSTPSTHLLSVSWSILLIVVDICPGDIIDQHRMIKIILLDQKVTFDVGYGINVTVS